jgi:hypothetical protein
MQVLLGHKQANPGIKCEQKQIDGNYAGANISASRKENIGLGLRSR